MNVWEEVDKLYFLELKEFRRQALGPIRDHATGRHDEGMCRICRDFLDSWNDRLRKFEAEDRLSHCEKEVARLLSEAGSRSVV